MAKATVPGNTAAVGITGTATTKPTTSLSNSTTSSPSSRASGSSSSSAKSSGTTSTKSASLSSSGSAVNAALSTEPQLDTAQTAAALAGIVNAARAASTKSTVVPVNLVDISRQVSALKSQEASDKQQAASQIDYGTAQAVNALNRTLQDSKALYQTQRNQTDADEAKALDNQALYAEARGDRGGIGQAQYGNIQSTAAANRQSINSAEVKLLTDTSRQIADLQAKGEIEKADKLASIGKAYLQELNSLQKWAQEKNIGVEEFNSKLSQWQQEYDRDVEQALTSTELAAAKALISAGITPNATQRQLLGWTEEDAWANRMAQRSAV